MVINNCYQYTEQNALDAGIGPFEDIDSAGCQRVLPPNNSQAGCSYEQEHVAKANTQPGCQWEQDGQQKIGVFFDSECPGVSYAADVVLNVEEVAPKLMDVTVARNQHQQYVGVILRPDF